MVAILFCDVCGFTAMSEKLDPEEVSDIIQPLFQECNAAIAKFGGIVEKFIGDAIMALFGVPMAHEDDPERAALAALEMRSIIQRFGADLEKRMGFSINMRIGLNVGTVVAGTINALEGGGGKNHQVLGDSINTAARMEQNAVPGNILVTEEMYHLIKDSFELKPDKLIQAKGKKEPLQAYDLVGVRQLRQRSRGLTERQSPLVGRQELLNSLSSQCHEALRERQPLSLLLQGDSGLGKTRLAMETYNQLLDEVPNLRLLQGTATSYSRGFAYFTLQNLVRSLLEVDETVPHAEVHQRIQDLMQHEQIANASLNSSLLEYLLYPHLEIPQLKLMSPDRLQQQIFRSVSDILLQLGKRQPLLLLMDDLQWCDPLSLQWLQGFQQSLQQQQLPLILLGTSRLDTSEEMAGLHWQEQRLLEPLNNEQALLLLNALLERGETTELPLSLQPLGEAILERVTHGRAPSAVAALDNGHLLVTDMRQHTVSEITTAGEVVWSYGTPRKFGRDENLLFSPEYATRLSNGHTLIADTGNSRVIEVDSKSRIVWSLLSGTGLRMTRPTRVERLPDGHTLVEHSNRSQWLEVNRELIPAWRYAVPVESFEESTQSE
ncbi:MAG: AAA family ATPase [Candidatus Sericytochromatia bacterium]|nr:AAA family ATPase [Candidatus Sericytochromatia bacterium]